MDKVKFMKNYDQTYKHAQRENEILHREMREQKAHNYELIKEYERTHHANMILRDPYKTKISQESLKGTYLNTGSSKRRGKKSRKNKLKIPGGAKRDSTGGFGDSPLASPRYGDAIAEEDPGTQEMVAIEIDDDFAKDIESDEDD